MSEETHDNMEPQAELQAESVMNTENEVTEVTEAVAEPVTEAVTEPVAEAPETPVAETAVDESPVAEQPVAPEPKKVPAKPAAPQEFDWDAIGKKHEVYTSEERTRLEDAYDQTLRAIQDHEVIEGTVVAMTKSSSISASRATE